MREERVSITITTTFIFKRAFRKTCLPFVNKLYSKRVSFMVTDLCPQSQLLTTFLLGRRDVSGTVWKHKDRKHV